MRSSLVVFVALVCFGLIAAAATVAGAETKNPDREKVVAQLKNIVKNWKAKNVEGILASYADDAREFYAAVQVDGKSNIRKMYEMLVNMPISVTMNAGSQVYKLTDDLYMEEVGNQRFVDTVFPRFRIWKKTADGEMLLWRHPANGFPAPSTPVIDPASPAQNAAVGMAVDEQKKSNVRAKIVDAFSSIIGGVLSANPVEITKAVSKTGRVWVATEHLAGHAAITGLFTRVGRVGFKLDAINCGNVYFLNETLVMEEGATFKSNLGSGRLFNVWQIVPKEAPENSVPTPSIDEEVHAGEERDTEVKLWRSAVLGPLTPESKSQ